MTFDELLQVVDNWQLIRVTDGNREERVLYAGNAEDCHPWSLDYKNYDVVEVYADGEAIVIEVG